MVRCQLEECQNTILVVIMRIVQCAQTLGLRFKGFDLMDQQEAFAHIVNGLDAITLTFQNNQNRWSK